MRKPASTAPFLALIAASLCAPLPASAEDWKGQSDGADVHLGGLTGMGTIDSEAGFALLGTASKKVVERGFVPDLNDSVSLETELGPFFTHGAASFMYSLHLRWDFQKDEQWTFYGLGGVSGHVTGGSLGDRFILFPRFGVGAMYRVNDLIEIRGELSRELIGLGVSIPLYL